MRGDIRYRRFAASALGGCIAWLSGVVIVGSLSEGSAGFILCIPLIYYGILRLQAGSRRTLWTVAILISLIAILLSSAVVRRAVATYLLRQASVAAQEGEIARALRLVVRAECFARDHPDVLYARHLWTAAQGRTEESTRWLARAVEAGHDDTDSLYALARLYAKTGQRAKEIPLYFRIVQRDPANPEANYCLAMYYDTQLRDRARAVRHLRIARDNLSKDNVWRKRCDDLLAQLGAE